LPIGRDTAFIGEIGLSGEIRHVAQLSKRVAECAKMGIKRVFVPSYSMEKGMNSKIKTEGVSTLSDVLSKIF
ncbi:MAG: magnesium chelatase domain-containing protein, partial [Christensenellaceae bacterium]